MKRITLFVIVAVCLLGGLAVAYSLGILGDGLTSKENKVVATHPPMTTPAPGSSGRVTMIDAGATECIPCKMMAPIMEELEKEYAGIADIFFIDVWKNPAEGRKYGIQTIPTQIFYDKDGKEVFRHVGFLDKKPIVEVLTRMGATLPAPGLSTDLPKKARFKTGSKEQE
jgi:thioredoxin 1